MIISLFRVPPSIVGIIETANLGSGNGEAQKEQFKNVMNAKAKFYEAAFNKVLGRNGFNEVFSFNEIDIEDELKRANIEGMQVRDGIRTVNEVRKDYGWDPVDWGDYPINNNNLDVLTEDLGMKSLENGRRYKNNLYKSGLLENWMF